MVDFRLCRRRFESSFFRRGDLLFLVVIGTFFFVGFFGVKIVGDLRRFLLLNFVDFLFCFFRSFYFFVAIVIKSFLFLRVYVMKLNLFG